MRVPVSPSRSFLILPTTSAWRARSIQPPYVIGTVYPKEASISTPKSQYVRAIQRISKFQKGLGRERFGPVAAVHARFVQRRLEHPGIRAERGLQRVAD